MSRPRRLVLVIAAWALPSAWTALVLLSGPSDGSSVAGTDWDDSITIAETYGETPLRAGDLVLEVEGRDLDAWVTGDPPVPTVGDTLSYRVRQQGEGLDRVVTVEVPLERYPVRAALRDELPVLAVLVMPLLAGTVVAWRRPTATSWGLLAGAALVPAAVTAGPLGPGVVDLAGGWGVWPSLGGQVAVAVALGCALLAAITFAGVPAWLRRRPWAAAAPLGVPLAFGVGWALIAASRLGPGAARLHALTSIALPAFLVAAPLAVGLLASGYRHATLRPDRVAVRLVLLALAGGAGVRVLLVDMPVRLTGSAIVPWRVLALFLVPAVLACLVVAVLRYRLDTIEPGVRRGLAQGLAAAVVGAAFAAVAGAVGLASGTSFEALVAGGILAVLLLPLAVALQRGVRRLVLGDRELPRQVVSELRALDPLTAPEEVLGETLTLLARRLHLSFAAIEVAGDSGQPIGASTGESRGEAMTVDLMVAGSPVGRLLLEVDPDRDPFGAGDRRMLEDVGSQVGALAQAVRINQELQRSREALVTAREEERRRVRRDLHDGLGPSLATLAMGLEAAQDLIPEDPALAAELVGDLSDRVRDEIAEVRRLVDGLRPPALDQLGLVTALRQRADEHNAAAGAPGGGPGRMTWTLDAAADVEPLPAAIEVAAYRIVIEAVNNAARHSAAASCTVTLRREPDCLRISVYDAGVGLGAAAASGVGLVSMRERAEELGGTCTLTSSNGTGTVVEARLPLRVPPGPGGGR